MYLVSSRVHPGETPASFVFNGFLEFVLRPDDPRAKQLRRQYVIKMIPMLNPDGVQRGHYRTDSRGVNLNRMYQDPSFELYPSIYASKSVLVYHHCENRVTKKNSKGDIDLLEEMYGSVGLDGAGEKCLMQNTSEESQIFHDNINYPEIEPIPVTVPTPRNSSCQPVVRSRTYNVTYGKNGTSTTSVVTSDTSAGIVPVKISESNLNSSLNSCTELDRSEVFTSNDKTDGSHYTAGPGSQELLSGLRQMTLDNQVCHMDPECPDIVGKYDGIRSLNDVASGGECEDGMEEGHIGNEGSDDDDDFDPLPSGVAVYAPHLSDPKLREIPPHESGIALYVDLHGHASKRGCFIYGNYFEQEDKQVENMLFPKLISLNTAHFDFAGCNFTERNMYMKDKRDGLSKEGAGRVAMYKSLGITHR